jgi:hypothetical protein
MRSYLNTHEAFQEIDEAMPYFWAMPRVSKADSWAKFGQFSLNERSLSHQIQEPTENHPRRVMLDQKDRGPSGPKCSVFLCLTHPLRNSS